MSQKEIRKNTLCNNNLMVKHYLTQLRALLKKQGVTDPQVYALINESRETLRAMKTQGQHMENRLRSYHDAICSLSFKRVKRNKTEY